MGVHYASSLGSQEWLHLGFRVGVGGLGRSGVSGDKLIFMGING